MANLKELRSERIRKLEELKRLGVNPYPATSHRTHMMGEIVRDFERLEGKAATVAGRIVGIRKFGKLAFIVLKDVSGQLQLFLKDGDVGVTQSENSQLGLEHLNLLDTGDFIEASGPIIKSKTGEISIAVKTLRLLTKSLRPMPTKQDGFVNKEERMRRRYVDMNVNQDVRERFVRRSKFWQATRDFLLNNNFTEINIPVLEHTTGGADATPFVTHMDALDQDFYLRISHELPLKRLLGAGFERVFDIGPRFRNENYSDEHLPEHVAFESYGAYQDYEDGMELYERMMKDVALATWGTLQFKDVNGFDIDLDGEWPRVDYADIMKKEYDVDVFKPDLKQLKAILKKEGVKLDGDVNVNRAMDHVWKLIRKRSAGPFWMIHEPVAISPLAKQDPNDPRVSQRFHPVIAGTEMGNGYSELNDPIEQLNRFVEQQKLRDEGDSEAQMLDIDFVEMLEYGMPPACGWSYSERYFWMFEGVTAREGVPFPQLRAEVDEVTKGIYPDVQFSHSMSRRPNTLAPTSELMSEEHRLAYQMVVILKEGVEIGRLINAANHAVAGLVGTMHNPGKFDFLEYRDKTGELDAIIAHHPAIIFRASDSKDLLKAYKKAQGLHIPNNAFIKTMTLGSSVEEMDILQKTSINDLDFWALALFGKTEVLKEITKNFQLWK